MCKNKFSGKHFKRESMLINKFCLFDYVMPTMIGLCLIVAAASGVYYLSIINNNATRGYVIGDLNKKVNELSAINEENEIAAAKLREMARIEELAKGLAMEKGGTMEFLQQKEGQMAKR